MTHVRLLLPRVLALTAQAASAQVFGPTLPGNSNAATDTGHDYAPVVAADGAGTWITVWRTAESFGGLLGGDYDIVYTRSTDDGQTVSPPTALHSNAGSDAGGDFDPDVATDGDEVAAGSDPLDAASVPPAAVPALSPAGLLLACLLIGLSGVALLRPPEGLRA